MKVLITGAFQYTEEQFKQLNELDLEIIFFQNEKMKITTKIDEIEYVICNSLFIYNDIKDFKNLKYIQITSAGLDRLPLNYIKENGIKLFNAKGVYSIPIAEWTILKILEIYKKSKVFYRQQEECKWEKQRDLIELNEKKACIIGYGSIGKEIAKRLSAFNVKIIAVDRKGKSINDVDKFYSIEEIDKGLSNSDIIILTLPLTEETNNIIDNSKLEIMKQDSILINVSRGKIINEEDLKKHLDKRKFKGVILDVFKSEPLDKDDKLWKYDNVILTPHNCFVSDKNNERLFQIIKNNLKAVKEELK